MVFQAKDIMDPNFLTVDEESDALSCARRMVAARKGYVVLTRTGTPRWGGIATEWDFLEKILAPGLDPSQVRMKQIASPELRSCSPDTPTDEVASSMADLGIRRMLVRSGDQVLGVITSKNVLSVFRQYIDRLSSEIAGFHAQARPLG
jgi:signal-transduction protein with cAMP-binding, CBS, and nucleotidyltransferase domain